MKPDEATLVEECLRHDPKACRQLYDRFAPRMFGVCMRYARSREAAEDILHDGFIKVFDSLGRLRDTTQLEAFIRSLMIHTAISTYRRESKVDAVTSFTDNESVFQSMDDIYGNIDVEIIMKAVQQLPTAYRMAFNLCDIEGYSFADAAKKIGVSESTVRSNLSRARHILASKLSDIFKR